jgi:hypothetical protein
MLELVQSTTKIGWKIRRHRSRNLEGVVLEYRHLFDAKPRSHDADG